MTTSISIHREYPHPVEKVWRALTDPDLLGIWLMPNDFQPIVGHEFTFRTEPAPGFDGIVHCKVVELKQPTHLVFSWKGGPIDTIVSFDLSRCAQGTKLHMKQSGFEGAKGWLISRMLKLGTRKMYGQLLPAVLDQMDALPASELQTHVTKTCMSPYQRVLVALQACIPTKGSSE